MDAKRLKCLHSNWLVVGSFKVSAGIKAGSKTRIRKTRLPLLIRPKNVLFTESLTAWILMILRVMSIFFKLIHTVSHLARCRQLSIWRAALWSQGLAGVIHKPTTEGNRNQTYGGTFTYCTETAHIIHIHTPFIQGLPFYDNWRWTELKTVTGLSDHSAIWTHSVGRGTQSGGSM